MMGACKQESLNFMAGKAAISDSSEASVLNDGEWSVYGGNYSNTRYSPLSQINVANANRLRVAWRHEPHIDWRERLKGWRTEGPEGWRRRLWYPHPRVWGREKQVSSPLVIDGVVYYTGAYNVITAVDAATGRELWRYHHKMTDAPLLCCGPYNRGVAAYGDKIFVGTLDAHLLALNRHTGALEWSVKVADVRASYSITMAPLVAAEKVIVGVSGADFGIRGFIDAYDWRTGTHLWRFWTVPAPEEGGWWGPWVAATPDGDSLPRDLRRERADSAKYSESWKHGGGSVWMTPSYDPQLGYLFAGVGNPAPSLDGTSRPGDNLYTCSIIALDVQSGALRWYYQVVPHDLWDTDLGNPTVLFEMPDSTKVPAIAVATKSGWVYVLDRRTGRRILRSASFVPQRNMFVAPDTLGRVYYPAVWGGATGAMPAYSPLTGLFYVLGAHDPAFLRRLEGPVKPGPNFSGGQMLHREADSTWGTLSAVDMRTGSIIWQTKTPSPLSRSGALVTGGGVILFGQRDFLHVLDARSGRSIWAMAAQADVDGPPITFSVNGRQYVAVVTQSGLVALTLSDKEP
jgi:PQQ-dependent dehydrogenase (methanol/ethanol family)